jgi:hypothetical protein
MPQEKSPKRNHKELKEAKESKDSKEVRESREPIVITDSDTKTFNFPGSIECDIPSKIISAKLTGNNEVLCLVEWKTRYDGTLPDRSYYSNKELRSKYACLLLDYYESKLKVEII